MRFSRLYVDDCGRAGSVAVVRRRKFADSLRVCGGYPLYKQSGLRVRSHSPCLLTLRRQNPPAVMYQAVCDCHIPFINEVEVEKHWRVTVGSFSQLIPFASPEAQTEVELLIISKVVIFSKR